MADKKPPTLKVVRGSRVDVRTKNRKPPATLRVVFVPGTPCIDHGTYYPMLLVKPVVVTVPESAISYEALEGEE